MPKTAKPPKPHKVNPMGGMKKKKKKDTPKPSPAQVVDLSPERVPKTPILPPAARTAITLRAKIEPPECDCWSSERTQWLEAGEWPSSMLDGIESSGLSKEGFKATICTAPDIHGHRKMHISLSGGTVKLDLPLLEDYNGVTYYTQHFYCADHGMFEWMTYSPKKPQTPIRWIRHSK